MKILLIADPTIPVPPILYGGIERIVDGLVNEYIKLGYDVYLLCHRDSLPNPKCHVFYYSKTKNDIFINSMRVFGVYLKCRPDVVHSFGRLVNVFLLSILKIPIVFSYQREPNISRVKWIVFFSNNRRLFFTGCSEYISNIISPYCKVATVFNFSKNCNLEVLDLVSDGPLMFLGRIEEIKGVHVAIEVANSCGRDLLICGNLEREHVDYFDSRIKPFLNDRIKFLGPVNDNEKFNYLRISQALLMPILWEEPFGIVMAESFSVGTPVIGFSRGSVKEVVKHGINGYVCESTLEMVDFVNCIDKIKRSTTHRDYLSRFTVEVIALEYLSIYKKIVS